MLKAKCAAGTAALTAYELLYVYPNWQDLINKPMRSSGSSYAQAIGLLITFGVVYNVHRCDINLALQLQLMRAVFQLHCLKGPPQCMQHGRYTMLVTLCELVGHACTMLDEFPLQRSTVQCIVSLCVKCLT